MPSFNYMGGVLPANHTLTRASTGWYINSSGTFTSAANDTARFTYNPATLVIQGLLVEPSRTNNSIQSTVASWTAGNSTLGAGAATAPDGGANATRMTENSVTNSHLAFNGVTGSSGLNSSASMYVHVGSGGSTRYPWLNMQAGAGNGFVVAISDIANIAVGQTGVGSTSGAFQSASIFDAGGGWRRIMVTGNYEVSGQSFIETGLSTGLNGQTFTAFAEVSYAGDNTSNLLFWGGQFELATPPSTLIPTTTGTVTRAADVLTLNSTAVPNGTYNITIVRMSGVTYLAQVAVSGGYTVPTDPSPLQAISFDVQQLLPGSVM